jgi:Berberine and berberine like
MGDTIAIPGWVRASFTGELVGPADIAYEEARRVHNGLIGKRPGLIARCRTVPDIVDAVNLMGEYGLTIDNLLSAEVVTAAGEVMTASAEENEDLFWALRGGGGNFGVATSFEYQAHPVPAVRGGMAGHPVSRAREVLDLYRQVTSDGPDELTAYFSLFASPGQSAEKLAAIVVCHCGDDPAAVETDLKPLRQFGPPLADTIQAMPCPVINTLSDAGYPMGALNYWKSAFFAEMSDTALQIMVDALERCPSGMSGLSIVPYLGAVTRADTTATAFAHRAPGYSLLIVSQWRDPAQTDLNITWARETFEALRPYMAGRRYVNNLPADDTRMVREIWGINYERLVQVKRRYDPDNVFRLNHNIDPGQVRPDAAPPTLHQASIAGTQQVLPARLSRRHGLRRRPPVHIEVIVIDNQPARAPGRRRLASAAGPGPLAPCPAEGARRAGVHVGAVLPGRPPGGGPHPGCRPGARRPGRLTRS